MNGPAKELLTAREVAARIRVSIRTVWRWTAAGALPPPVRTGGNGRIVRWKADDIDQFIEDLPVGQTR